jgi:hypothetical protein
VEDLEVMIENLSKKSEFFREKSLQLANSSKSNEQSDRTDKNNNSMPFFEKYNTLTPPNTVHSSLKDPKTPNSVKSIARTLALKVKYLKNYIVKERMNVQADIELCKKYIRNCYNLITLKLQEDGNHKSFLKRELNLAQKNLKNYEKMLRDISLNMNEQLKSDISNSNLKPSSERFYTNEKYTFTDRTDMENNSNTYSNSHSPLSRSPKFCKNV